MQKLIVISAPSGAGKTTLCQMLLRDFPELVLSISSTTRAPRGTDRHGVEYFFLTREEFEKEIQENKFAEWALVHGNYYGTSKDVIERAFKNQKSVLLDIDVQGAENIRKIFPKEAVLFFITPPNMEELECRLRSRGTDSEDTIQRRMNHARAEISKKDLFDHVVINDALDPSYLVLKDLVTRELKGKGSTNG